MALPFLWHMPHETEAHPERVNYFGSIGRKVPMALATSSPLSFLASPSQKMVLLPARMTHNTLDTSGEMMRKATPTRRLGGPEDLKGVAVLLASDAGQHITGQAISVDGGVMLI